jgi:ribonuclease BN (tRNA processing enzyme)
MRAAKAEKPSGPTPQAPSRLALSNGGALDLTFVGAGSAFSKKFFQNNLLAVKGKDHLLIDFGTRASEALALLGLGVADISNFLITHLHADHIGGLEEAMLINHFALHRKGNIVVADRLRKNLWSMSLRGGASFNEERDGAFLEFEDFWDSIATRRIKGADRELCEARIGGIEARLFRTMHIPDSSQGWASSFPSYGVILDRRVLFTSDTRYDPAMVISLDEEYGFEVIFHDCQLFKGGVHASLDELAGLPPEVRAKTRLMHYGDKIEDFRQRIEDLGFAGIVEQWKTYSFPHA